MVSRCRGAATGRGFRHLGEFAFHGFNLFVCGRVLEGACFKDRECRWAVGVVSLFPAVLLVCARRGLCYRFIHKEGQIIRIDKL